MSYIVTVHAQSRDASDDNALVLMVAEYDYEGAHELRLYGDVADVAETLLAAQITKKPQVMVAYDGRGDVTALSLV